MMTWWPKEGRKPADAHDEPYEWVGVTFERPPPPSKEELRLRAEIKAAVAMEEFQTAADLKVKLKALLEAEESGEGEEGEEGGEGGEGEEGIDDSGGVW